MAQSVGLVSGIFREVDPIDYRDEIISSVAETACNKLTKKVIRELLYIISGR